MLFVWNHADFPLKLGSLVNFIKIQHKKLSTFRPHEVRRALNEQESFRRSFVTGATGAGALAVLAGLAGCNQKKDDGGQKASGEKKKKLHHG